MSIDRIAGAFGTDADALEASLDDWLGAPVPTATTDGTPDTPSRVLPAADEDRADRILGRVRRIDAEHERIKETAARRITEIEAWRDDLTAGLTEERARAEESLELFMREWHRANPKRKSVKLVNGTLALRQPSAGKVEVTDETAFKRWAHEHPEVAHYVRWQPEPDKTALKAVETRHTRPDETVDDELHHTWGILVETASEGGEVMQTEVPGIRFIQRVRDKFSAKTADELAKPEPEEEQ